MADLYKINEEINIISPVSNEIANEITEPALVFQFIINKVLAGDNSDNDLTKFAVDLQQIQLASISSNINSDILIQLIQKYQITQNINEERCLLYVIEFLSMFESIIPELVNLHFFDISIEKIQIPSPNSYLILKIICNLFSDLENKENCLKTICSLAPHFAQFEDRSIFDQIIQFIYNYSLHNEATQNGAALIVDFMSQFFQFFQKQSDISAFSIERILWTFALLCSKFSTNLDPILHHPIFTNKSNYLTNCPIEITVPFLVFSKHLFEKDLNPFDLHISDILPFLSSEHRSLVSSSLFLLSSQLNFSDEMQKEFQNIDLKLFEELFLNSDYNIKLEYSFLFQCLFHYIHPEEINRFFIENADFIFQFLSLDNDVITLHVLKFMNDLFNDVADRGTETFSKFIHFLIDHDFIDILEENALNSLSDEISLYAVRLLAILKPEFKEDTIENDKCVINITSLHTSVAPSGFL